MSFPQQGTLPALEILVHIRGGGEEVELYLSILESTCTRLPERSLGFAL